MDTTVVITLVKLEANLKIFINVTKLYEYMFQRSQSIIQQGL